MSYTNRLCFQIVCKDYVNQAIASAIDFWSHLIQEKEIENDLESKWLQNHNNVLIALFYKAKLYPGDSQTSDEGSPFKRLSKRRLLL